MTKLVEIRFKVIYVHVLEIILQKVKAVSIASIVDKEKNDN